MGFAGMITSSFQSVFIIGLLITITLISALLCDLLLLPFLILEFYKRKELKQKAKLQMIHIEN